MKKDIIAILILIAAVTALLAPMLFNRLGIFYDDYYETFSRLNFIARTVRSGALPLWDPHTFAGGRINFIPNTRIWYWPLYPFYLLTSLSSADSVYAGVIKIPLFIHWLICALTAYGLGRLIIRLHPVGAAILALIYSFGAAMSYNVCDPNTTYAIVWIPLALWGIAAWARSRALWPAILGALAISFIGPCGSDVRGIFSLAAIAITVFFLSVIITIQKSWKSGRRMLLAGVLLFILGLLLSGPYWAAMTGTISIYRGSPLLRASRSASEMFSMPWRHLLTLSVPDLFGTLTAIHHVDLGIPDLADYSHLEGNITGGFALLLLCLLGSLLGWRKRSSSPDEVIRRRWWWAGAALLVFSLLLITGRYSPVYRGLIRVIPVFGLPYAVRWRILEHLGIALLAGVSAHWLWTSRRKLSCPAIAAFFVTVFGVAAWQVCQRVAPGGPRLINYIRTNYQSWFLHNPGAYLGGALLLSLLLIFLARKRLGRLLLLGAAGAEAWALCFGVVYFLSYADVPEWIRYTKPSDSIYFQWTDQAALKNLPVPATGPERTTFSFSMLDQVASLHGGNYLMGHCSKPLEPRLCGVLQSLTSGYPYALRINQADSRFFPNMSVRHLVINRPRALSPAAASVSPLPEGGLYDYRLKNTVPRVFTQDRVVMCSPEQAREELLNGDLRRAAFLDDGKRSEKNGKRLAVSGKRSAGDNSLPGEGVMSYKEFLEMEGDEIKLKAEKRFEELQKTNRIERVRLPSPNRMNILIEVKKPALLVTTDVFYPGWRVSVDDQFKTPLRVNYLQRGVWLKRGKHRVEWIFRPPAVKWGFVLLGLGVIGLIGLVICPRRSLKI